MTLDKNDKRFSLVELLKRYKPADDADNTQKLKVLDFVLATPTCFERKNLPGHITGSAWIVNPSRNKVLLTHHKKLSKWLQLGGHADGNPDVLSVALKEAHEESGLDGFDVLIDDIFDLDIHMIPANHTDPQHYHFDIRFLLGAAQQQFSISHESNDLAWIALNELHQYSNEVSLIRMARKFQNFIANQNQ